MTQTQVDNVRAAIEPTVAALGLDLYDVELLGANGSRTLRVTITRDGGIDLETITAVTQAVSPVVDQVSDLAGSYLLEVSSPGIERTLRRPEHFVSAIGEEVSIKFHTDAGPRRTRGVLRDFDGEHIVIESEAGERDEIALVGVTQARTVFEWGPQPRPGKGLPARARAKERS